MKGGADTMDGKFLGVGITNAFGLWLLFVVFSIIFKVILVKYPVTGLSDIVLAGA